MLGDPILFSILALMAVLTVVLLVRLWRRGTSDTAIAARSRREAEALAGAPASHERTFGPLTPVFSSLLPESTTRRERARRDLIQSGDFNPHAEENLSALRYVLMMLGLIIAGMALLLLPPRLEFIGIIGLVVLPIIGWSVPRVMISSRAGERRNRIERALPDMLDVLHMCVSQGLTVPQSLNRVSRELRDVHPDLAKELRIVCEQAEIGTLDQALENFAWRVDAPDVKSFSTLLIQTERMGTSLSTALMEYSDAMRESLRQRADEKGNRAAFRLLFPTVLCLMPAVYLFLLGPAVVELSNFFDGTAQQIDETQNLRRTTDR